MGTNVKLFAITPPLLVLVALCGAQVAQVPGSISGVAFYDVNHNGIRDKCDDKLRLVTVEAVTPEGEVLTAKTDKDGVFAIEDVPVGSVRLQLEGGVGNQFWPLTTVAADGTPGLIVPVETRKQTTGVEIGSALNHQVKEDAVTVLALVYEDANGNDRIDRDECGIPDSAVWMNTEGDVPVSYGDETREYGLSVMTGGRGASLVGAMAGSGAWRYTGSPDQGITCTTGVRPQRRYGGQVYEVNIGFQRAVMTGAVSGYVFEDKNGDGARAPGEPVVAGASVSLSPTGMLCSNVYPDSVTTDGAGRFIASGLADGEYAVYMSYATPERDRLIFQAGEMPVTATVRGGEALEIDVPVVVEPAATIQVRVFYDVNSDGIRQEDEGFVEQAQVCARPADIPVDELAGEVGDGSMYMQIERGPGYGGCGGLSETNGFTDPQTIGPLRLGEYYITVSAPNKYLITEPAPFSVSLTEPGVKELELPLAQPSTPDLVIQPGSVVQQLGWEVCYTDPAFVQRPFEDGYDPDQNLWSSWDISEAEARELYDRGIYIFGNAVNDAGANVWRVIANPGWSSGRPPSCPLTASTTDNIIQRQVYMLVGYSLLEAVSQGAVLQFTLQPGDGVVAFYLSRDLQTQYTLFVDESSQLIKVFTYGAWLD